METTFDVTLTSLDERKAAASRATGINPDTIRGVRLEMDVLRQNGLLVDLNISGTSMLSRSASWIELGVLDATTQERFTRGRKSLFMDAEKQIKSIEVRLRQVLEKLSYDVSGFRPYRWLAWTAYNKFREEFDRLSDEFRQIKQYEILDRYDDHVDRLVEDFTKVAHASWKAIQGQGYDGATIDGVTYYDVDSFTDEIIRRALEKMPSREEIEKGLYVDYTTALVYGEQDSALDQLEAQRLRNQKDHEMTQARIERQEAWLKVQDQELELDRKQRRLEAMRQAEMEHARQKLQEIGSPFVDIITQLRGRMAEDAESILESIKKNGYLRGKVAEKGRGLIEFYDIMAAHDDQELRQKLESLKTEIGHVSTERNVDKISDILAEISDLAHASAQDLTEVSQAAFVSI
jgi:hypothetical protein